MYENLTKNPDCGSGAKQRGHYKYGKKNMNLTGYINNDYCVSCNNVKSLTEYDPSKNPNKCYRCNLKTIRRG